jgi:hypothetical protein
MRENGGHGGSSGAKLLALQMDFVYSLSVFFLLLLLDWDLNSGLHSCKVSALLLKLRLQSILLWLFWRWGWSHELFAWAGLEL